MYEPFIAAIVLFAGNFGPRGWYLCMGQIMSISQNTALFSLLGTSFGGNGQTTFALPDLRGRAPIGTGQGPGLPPINLGQIGGAPTHTLIITEMPAHNHVAMPNLTATPSASTAPGTSNTPAVTMVPAVLPSIGGGPAAQQIKGYAAQDNTTTLAPGAVTGSVTIGIAGGSQPHNIMQPYLGMNYIIAVEGVYPSRN
ncbi:phage tail protein [Chitinophaga rhizophila]|uniref:Tail fiber protein n=1 Tax=Chitinophaga rhizophila TaxID=2866212 RepID=A0ABS7GBT4_9BACT|nr:tail fiber protein [Chitinophaga rhizophila]MBW8684590.1 tail fiber protein [Chitinophaga rhizophila]